MLKAVSNTGSGGGGGGSGTVNSGTAGQIAYYATTDTVVSGNANLTISSGALTIGVATSQQGSLILAGGTSGSLTIAVPAIAGSNTITLPAGTTDFTATGGTSRVLKQTSVGGAITVAQLAASDLSNGTIGSGAVALAVSPTFTGTVGAAAITATGNVSVGTLAVTVGTPSGTGLYLATTNTIGFQANNAGIGAFSVGSFKLGASDVASPVAQLIRVQNVVTGTSDTAGANFTIAGSQGTGTGAGGSIIWQVAPASTTGSTPNTLVTGASLSSAGIFDLNQSGSIIRLQGANFAFYPNTDSTATGASIAIGVSALSTQNAAGSAAYNNVAIGYQAAAGGTLTTAAIKNVLIGFQAANSLTSGAANVVIGYQAATSGTALQSGGSNVIIGSLAHTSSASSGSCVVIGQNSSVAGNSVSIGQGSSANGGSSVVIGLGANDGSNSGAVLVGASAGNASNGTQATGIGLSALNSSTGAGNTAVGNTAAKFVSSGANNVAVGFQALLGITGTKVTGAGNVAVGKDAALAFQGVAANNVCIGISTGSVAAFTGVNNVIIGPSVCSTTLVTGGSNIYIGASSAIDATSSSTSNELKIGNSSTPVISATAINSTPVITLGGATTISGITTTSSGRIFKVTDVTSTPYTVLSSDYFLAVKKASTVAITLPTAPANGTRYEVKDVSGAAGANAITISRGGSDTIDGATTAVINTNYGALTFTYNTANTIWLIT